MHPPALSFDDRASLRCLVDAYADAVDRRDPADLMALFAADAEVRVQRDEDGPVEASWSGAAIGDLLDTLAGFKRTFHHIGGSVFDAPDGPAGVATGRSTCLAHHYLRSDAGPVDLVMMIHYHDRFTRDPGRGWLFSRRRVDLAWTELHPAQPRRA